MRLTLLLVAFTATLTAAPIYSFRFTGTLGSGSSFVAPPTALQTVQPGDAFVLTFDVDAGASTSNNIIWSNAVSNIVASFPGRNITLQPAGTTFFQAYSFASLYDYRWDIAFPGDPTFTMVFWFRTPTPGVVQPAIPQQIDSTQFSSHAWAVYQGTYPNGGPQALLVSIDTAIPEPGTFLVAAVGLALLAFQKTRRLRS